MSIDDTSVAAGTADVPAPTVRTSVNRRTLMKTAAGAGVAVAAVGFVGVAHASGTPQSTTAGAPLSGAALDREHRVAPHRSSCTSPTSPRERSKSSRTVCVPRSTTPTSPSASPTPPTNPLTIERGFMSSHREAPEIAKDPVADSTDLYAFVSPDSPDTVTLIANYVPLQSPAGGPNFYEFGNAVMYDIHIDNNGDGRADVTYRFQFNTKITNKNTFLYNTGADHVADQRELEPQAVLLGRPASTCTATRPCSRRTSPARRATSARCPRRTTPALAAAAMHSLPGGRRVFAGQRAEGFYVDLGSIFDLVNLRPLQTSNVFGESVFTHPALGVNATDHVNVHSIAIQVPISDVRQTGGTSRRRPTRAPSSASGRRPAASR